MLGFTDAYLDIETTGLYADQNKITIVGIYFCNEDAGRLVQLYNEKLTLNNLFKVLEGTEHLYTYNGRRFDLPFICMHLGPDLSLRHNHIDLMYECWKYNLKGGFKAVLRRLGITRETDGLTGLDAIWLWEQYENSNNLAALDLLLRYNRDDVVNLKQLKEYLQNMRSSRHAA